MAKEKIIIAPVENEKYSLKGWNFLDFLKGRKKLLITAVGAVVGYVATANPAMAAIAGCSAELLYAVFDYYIKE
jgi:hypothetical protein